MEEIKTMLNIVMYEVLEIWLRIFYTSSYIIDSTLLKDGYHILFVQKKDLRGLGHSVLH